MWTRRQVEGHPGQRELHRQRQGGMAVTACLGLRRGTTVWDWGPGWRGWGRESPAAHLPAQGAAEGHDGMALLLILKYLLDLP